MKICPRDLGGGRVLRYLSLDSSTARAIRPSLKFEGRQIMGVAICFIETEDEYYLFGCDENWSVLTDAWHKSPEDAQRQADFECPGCEGQWVNVL